jgi:hypothetical protein
VVQINNKKHNLERLDCFNEIIESTVL